MTMEMQKLPDVVRHAIRAAISGCRRVQDGQAECRDANERLQLAIRDYDELRSSLGDVLREHNIPFGRTFVIDGWAVRIREGSNGRGNIGISRAVGVE